MAAIKYVKDLPTTPGDNSHLPLTIKPGERFRFWYTPYYGGGNQPEWKRKSSPRDLLGPLAKDGHLPTLHIIGYAGNWGRTLEFDVTCSCGYTTKGNDLFKWSRFLNSSGGFQTGFVPRWVAHTETLSAPLKVWEAQAVRTKYTCYIVKGLKQAQAVGAKLDPKHYSYYINDYFSVVQHSTHGNKARIMNYITSLNGALAYAQGLGRKQEGKGNEVTWLENAPVGPPSGGAAAVLTAISEAKDVDMIIHAISLADEFLNYASLIEQKRDELKWELVKLTSLEDHDE